MKKRFIALALCVCTAFSWRENNIEHAECVKCGHQLSQPEADVSEHVQHNNQMIGIFKPE